ncbi:MAG: uracil-DNA glycosylase family protein [Bryobacteraceae bacterium]
METGRERLRRRYRPAKVRLLFIGEAPPASGRFFYQRDSGLYRAIRDAFCSLDPSVTDEGFLDSFQNAGCYLIDACATPVDQLDARSRRAACLASEALLSRRISLLQPSAIVILLRSIRSNVRRAAESAGWEGPMIELPYPGRWARHRETFLRTLVPQLKDRLNRGGGKLFDTE